MTEVLGWSASAILFITVTFQVYKQWREPEARGASPVLFLGQMTASVLFAVYAWVIGNAVFAFTNAILSVSAGVGFAICIARMRGIYVGPRRGRPSA